MVSSPLENQSSHAKHCPNERPPSFSSLSSRIDFSFDASNPDDESVSFVAWEVASALKTVSRASVLTGTFRSRFAILLLRRLCTSRTAPPYVDAYPLPFQFVRRS